MKEDYYFEQPQFLKIICLVLGAVLLGVIAFNLFGGEPEPKTLRDCGENTTASVPACFEIKISPTP